MNEFDQLKLALASDKQSGKSPLVEEYERALSSYFRADFALAVNSGSAAIQTALVALGAAPGRKVIVSAAAPLPTLIPIAATGAEIKFVDCQPDNPSIDAKALSASLDDDVVAVLEVPLWGYPQDYTRLLGLLAPLGIPLVEDAAQAHGATLDGRHVGTLATIGCFSTHEKKFLSTGEGGFILTNRADLYDRVKRFARLGHLDGASPGMNFKISAFTAAVGLARLQGLNDVLAKRRAVREDLLSNLAPWALNELEHVGEPNGYNLVIDCKDLKGGGDLHHALALAGIKTDVVNYGYKCGYQHRLFAKSADRCHHAEALVSRLVQLPTNIDNASAVARNFAGTMISYA
jgi:dTDP-4-amino-4,6-dideoxygalactose transaminase